MQMNLKMKYIYQNKGQRFFSVWSSRQQCKYKCRVTSNDDAWGISHEIVKM